MTITAGITEISYAGDNASTVFPVPFPFHDETDLLIVLTAPDGAAQTLTSGFTITGGDGETGEVTLDAPLASGYTLTIADNPELSQQVDYISNDAFPAETHEFALDKLTRIAKRHNARFGRTLRVQDGESEISALPPMARRTDQFFMFDSSGHPTVSELSVESRAGRLMAFDQSGNPTTLPVVVPGPGLAPGAYINVKDFGAKGDGSTNDTAAINRAMLSLHATRGGILFFPAGIYRIDALTISKPNVHLVGEGRQASVLSLIGSDEAALTFTPEDLTAGMLGNCGIRDIGVWRNDGSATSLDCWALRLIHCNSFSLRNFTSVNTVQGILVAGGQNNSLSEFSINGRVGGTPVAGSALLRCQDLASFTGNPSPQHASWLLHVADFQLSGQWSTQDAIALHSSDGNMFVNGYINQTTESLLRIETLSTGSAGRAVAAAFTNVYFEGSSGISQTPYGLHIPNSGAAELISDNEFTGCLFLGAFSGAAVRTRRGFGSMVFSGCHFAHGKNGFDLANGDSDSRLVISGGSLRAHSANAITLAGTLGGVVLSGISFADNTADFTNGAAIGQLSFTGCASDLAGSALNGSRFPNTGADDARALDWYEEGTFTPAVAFNGNTAGITYASREGRFTRIGNRVYFSLRVVLSSKGSNTGEARINGLPYTCGHRAAVACHVHKMQATNSGVLQAQVLNGESGVRISDVQNYSSVPLTDAYFTDASDINIAGQYEVA